MEKRPGLVFRLVTYLPRKFSRGDLKIAERRRSGYTTISVTRETRDALEWLCKDLEAMRAQAQPDLETNRISVEYLLAALTLGRLHYWERQDALPWELQLGIHSKLRGKRTYEVEQRITRRDPTATGGAGGGGEAAPAPGVGGK